MMNRFISAMPSSRCWPFGEKSQLKVEGIFSLPEQVVHFPPCANSPRRLTQAPRLVETVTSGDVVTMRAASSLSPRAISFSIEAKALLGRHLRGRLERELPRHLDRRAHRAGARPRG